MKSTGSFSVPIRPQIKSDPIYLLYTTDTKSQSIKYFVIKHEAGETDIAQINKQTQISYSKLSMRNG